MYEYVGSVHIHSTYSDGWGSVEKIAQAAREARLDFIIITDHDNMKGYVEGKEGWYGRTLVLFGTELNREDHHYLAFNLKEELDTRGLSPQETIDLVNQKGGFGFIAHPFEKGSPLVLQGKHYPWKDWKVHNFRGIEIWNYTSQWRDGAQNLPKALYSLYLHRNSNLKCPCPQSLQAWDRFLSRGDKVLALGGTDAHAVPLKAGPLRAEIFPYSFLFQTITTHIYLPLKLREDTLHDRVMVMEALQKGHYFTANDQVHPSRGFCYFGKNKEKQVLSGDTITMDKETVLEVESPSLRSIIRVIKEGRVVREAKSNNLIFKVLERGAFRVEVYYRPLLGGPCPWIYSNPIFVA
ncbi:MAG: PHP domain-containing protein [Candidatus Syntrophonatronum acetioxidans]|uniref:PHP domain-containing protein n=1 Tax=Candidatus Syntrophonatronum acetioxidans TaxID=1795816 RepID=A0A424YFY1_9FIRM|nr:MAG: PHP domain-containing protein [Candidatus Syntrophonatronum acetioxidans]